MLTLLIVAFVGSSMLNSNTTTVCDWVKDSQSFLSEGIVEPQLPHPDGRYVVMGPKELRWSEPYSRPEGIVFVPTGMENQPKKDAGKETSSQAKSAPKSVIKAIFELPASQKPIGKVEKVTSAGSHKDVKQEGIENLGILGDKKPLSGVNNDEILSFFQKTTTITPTGNEETGVILPLTEQKPAETTAESSATFESK